MASASVRLSWQQEVRVASQAGTLRLNRVPQPARLLKLVLE